MYTGERHAGTLSAFVAIAGILLATGLDPTFSWTGDALSDLGVRDSSNAVFNGALLIAGVLGVVYGVGLFRVADGIREQLVAVMFALATVHLAGVGLFVIGHPLHLPAAIGFYLLVTITFIVDGIIRRRSRWGRYTLLLAALQLLIWSSWIIGLWPGNGLALPEFAGALLVPLWIYFVGPAPTLIDR